MKKSILVLLTISLFLSVFQIKSAVAQGTGPVNIQDAFGPVVIQEFENLKVPGMIVGIWIGDNTPWITTMGFADLDNKVPMQITDKVRVGSITKTFTGTVALQLVDEGKLSLSDKLSKYFPDFPNGDNITIEMLGNMRSGIFNYAEDSTFANTVFTNPTTHFTPDELISIALKHPPYFAPNEGNHYSNTNTILIGLIIEKITGRTLAAELQERIFKPLGMNETSFPDNTVFPDPKAQGYIYKDSTQTIPSNITTMDVGWAWAAGSIISTLDDIKKYAKKVATGEDLVSKSSQEKRLTWSTQLHMQSGSWKGTDAGYGFCIADFEGALGHNGGIPGYNSFMGYYPEKDATIIVFVNMQDNKDGLGPADGIARKIVDKLKTM